MPKLFSQFLCQSLGVQCSLCGASLQSWDFSCVECQKLLYHLRMSEDFEYGALFRYEKILPGLITALRREEFQAPKSLLWTHFLESTYAEKFAHIEAVALVPSRRKWKQFGLRAFAQDMANLYGAELLPDLLVKSLPISQHEHDAEERLNAPFMIEIQEGFRVFGKSVLCIDDVFTSGTSMDQSIFAIQTAGALEVEGFTLAFTDLNFPALPKR